MERGLKRFQAHERAHGDDFKQRAAAIGKLLRPRARNVKFDRFIEEGVFADATDKRSRAEMLREAGFIEGELQSIGREILYELEGFTKRNPDGAAQRHARLKGLRDQVLGEEEEPTEENLLALGLYAEVMRLVQKWIFAMAFSDRESCERFFFTQSWTPSDNPLGEERIERYLRNLRSHFDEFAAREEGLLELSLDDEEIHKRLILTQRLCVRIEEFA